MILTISQDHLKEFALVISELNERNNKLKEEFAEIKREIKLPEWHSFDYWLCDLCNSYET